MLEKPNSSSTSPLIRNSLRLELPSLLSYDKIRPWVARLGPSWAIHEMTMKPDLVLLHIEEHSNPGLSTSDAVIRFIEKLEDSGIDYASISKESALIGITTDVQVHDESCCLELSREAIQKLAEIRANWDLDYYDFRDGL